MHDTVKFLKNSNISAKSNPNSNFLTCLSGGQMGSYHEKNNSLKSRDTLSLSNVTESESPRARADFLCRFHLRLSKSYKKIHAFFVNMLDFLCRI